MKMAKIWNDIPKFFILISLFWVKSLVAENGLRNLNDFLSFEQMKIDLFTGITKNISNYSNTPGDWKCIQELDNIGNGLRQSELWAEEIVDAWGKIPSGILDGNVVDFGAFTECFHIDRNGERYETMYCLSQVQLKLESFVRRRMNGTTLRIGLCVPASCSIDFLQKYFDTQTKNRGNFIKINKASCQIEEYPLNFTKLDWIFIGVLISTLVFILMSTTYDILCTTNEWNQHPVFRAFSLCSNGRDLFSNKSSRATDEIQCLDGIRVIASQLILLEHTQSFYGAIPSYYNIKELSSLYINTIFFHSSTATDTFFVLSGLLVTTSLLKQLKRTNGRINVPMLYIHRYLRLTPLLAVSILWIMSLYRFLGSGPDWPMVSNELKVPCEEKWWSTLLYIQNYVEPNNVCNIPSWYLSVDMQLYLLSPFIVYSIYRFNKKAICVLVILILGCVGCTIAVKSKHEITWWDEPHEDHTATHLRYSPWLVGVIAGYIFNEIRNKPIHIPKILNLIFWILSLAVMNAVLFAYHSILLNRFAYTQLEHGLFFGLSRVAWSIALCYIIFACHHNYGGAVNRFLGHSFWKPLSRLSYSIYLLQWPILSFTIGTTKNSIYLDELRYFHTAFGNNVFVVLVSIIATLAFQSPIIIIEKWIFSSKTKRDNESRDKNRNNNVERSNAQCGA